MKRRLILDPISFKNYILSHPHPVLYFTSIAACVLICVFIIAWTYLGHYWYLPFTGSTIMQWGVLKISVLSLSLLAVATLLFSPALASKANVSSAIRKALIIASPIIGDLIVGISSCFFEVGEVSPLFVILNWLILSAIFYTMFFILGRSRVALILFWIICLVFGSAMSFIMVAKGQVFSPADLLALDTAAEVSGGYTFILTSGSACALILFAACLCLLSAAKPIKITKKAAAADLGIASAIALSFVLVVSNLSISNCFNATIRTSNIYLIYRTEGVTLGFLNLSQTIFPEQPANYESSYARTSLERYGTQISNQDSPAGLDEQRGNLAESPISFVVIMNESFADLSIYPGLADTSLRPEAFWSIASNSLQSGFAYASVIGGGTANSEFEMLTGASMANIGLGSYPYQSYDLSKSESLPKYLSSLGYDTVAIHPEKGSNWRRNQIYQELGIDVFWNEHLVDENTERLRNHPKDSVTYAKVLELLQSNENPQFIFDVTMQNHGGYNTGLISDDSLIHVSLQDGREDASINEYATTLQESDSQLRSFVDSLEELNRPVILCFFGDHQPSVFRNISGQSAANDSENEDSGQSEINYVVPYFIWANTAALQIIDSSYPASADLDSAGNEQVTSLNYLGSEMLSYSGIPLRPLDRYLLSLSEEIPAMNVQGFLDSDGTWHNYSDESSMPKTQELLNQYRFVQYFSLFDN